MTLALALVAVLASHRPLELASVGAAFVFAVVWLVGTYRSRCLRDPLDELPPLDGDPLDEGWGKLA